MTSIIDSSFRFFFRAVGLIPRMRNLTIAYNLLFIYKKLKPRNQKQLSFLTLLMLVGSVAETVSIGSVIPFIGFIAYPARFWQYPKIQYLAGILSFNQPSDFVILFSLLFVASILLSAGLRGFILYYSSVSIQRIGSYLGCITFRRTLCQPYQDHISLQTGDVVNASISLIGSFVQLVSGLLNVLNSVLTAGLIFILLAIVSPVLTLSLLIFLFTLYSIIVFATKSELVSLGARINTNSVRLIGIAQESLEGIREVIINNLRSYYFKEYESADLQMRLSQARYQFVTSYPRIIVEAAALLAIVIFSLIITSRQGDFQSYLPVIAAIVFSFQKLLPLSQSIFNGISMIKFNQDSLQKIVNLLELNNELYQLQQKSSTLSNWGTFSLKSVSFRYGPKDDWIFRDVDFTFNRGECIGVVGETGSGKTTLIDIIVGLLEPEGSRYVDNSILTGENLQSWRSEISLVPQSVHLISGTILDNIYYMQPSSLCSRKRAFEAARIAQIHDFVVSLPSGYETKVGERGVKLSGGQRQRIAIARAIYLNSSILVFDESTNALDSETESKLISNLSDLPCDITKIFITHGNVERNIFDRVVRVVDKKIVTC